MNVAEKVSRAVARQQRGEPFAPKQFLRYGGRAAVDQALSRLARSGRVRRITRGLYVRPVRHPVLGEMPVPGAKVVRAIARAGGYRVQISGAEAANRLGLSTQVPMRSIYLTDGPSRTIALGQQKIELRHVSASRLIAAGTLEGDVISAMRYLGEALTREHEERLGEILTSQTKRRLVALLPGLPSWMAEPVCRIADG